MTLTAAMSQYCCRLMLGLTCVLVASGRLGGIRAGKARRLKEPACKHGHLTSQDCTQHQRAGACINQPKHVLTCQPQN